MKRGSPLRRTPMLRKQPIRSTAQTLRRSRLKPVSASKAPGVTDEVAKAVIARSKGVCERCQKVPGTELHHRVTRARGGPHDEFNLTNLCRSCHHDRAHGENEWPWLVAGSFLRGVYRGPDEAYLRQYPA